MKTKDIQVCGTDIEWDLVGGRHGRAIFVTCPDSLQVLISV